MVISIHIQWVARQFLHVITRCPPFIDGRSDHSKEKFPSLSERRTIYVEGSESMLRIMANITPNFAGSSRHVRQVEG